MKVVNLDFEFEIASFIFKFEFDKIVFEKRINIEIFLKMLRIIWNIINENNDTRIFNELRMLRKTLFFASNEWSFRLFSLKNECVNFDSIWLI